MKGRILLGLFVVFLGGILAGQLLRGDLAAAIASRESKMVRVPAEVLEPLFVSTWARWVSVAASRLGADDAPRDESTAELVEWLTSNRFRILWEYAVDHRRELNLTGERERSR